MAFSFKGFSTCVLLMITTMFVSIQFSTVFSVEFEVGGKEGWVIPPSKSRDLYNDWASRNRFQVNDTLHFMYKEDSVLGVTQEDYDKCRSAHPLFYSNNGNTIYTLDRSDLFFFISGVSGHCERGLKMIIKVMEEQESHPQSANQTSSTSSSFAERPAAAIYSASIVAFIFSLFGVVSV